MVEALLYSQCNCRYNSRTQNIPDLTDAKSKEHDPHTRYMDVSSRMRARGSCAFSSTEAINEFLKDAPETRGNRLTI